ncbi:Calpain-like protease, partial [Phytophthora palmivora]
MAQRHYAEALDVTERAQSFERAGQAAQAVPLFQQALHILKRLAQSSDFLLAKAMEQHAAAREAEESDASDSVVDKYIAAADSYMQALNALPSSATTAKAAVKEQLEYVIDYVSKLKNQNQIQVVDDDVDVAALQWPEPPVLQLKTTQMTQTYTATPSTPVAQGEEKTGAAYTPQELDVLRRSSQINGHLFVPWLDDLDAQEKFSLPEPFEDPDGHVPLSVKQKKKNALWMRPSDYAAKCGHAPVMIAQGGVNPLVVKQDIVTD